MTAAGTFSVMALGFELFELRKRERLAVESPSYCGWLMPSEVTDGSCQYVSGHQGITSARYLAWRHGTEAARNKGTIGPGGCHRQLPAPVLAFREPRSLKMFCLHGLDARPLRSSSKSDHHTIPRAAEKRARTNTSSVQGTRGWEDSAGSGEVIIRCLVPSPAVVEGESRAGGKRGSDGSDRGGGDSGSASWLCPRQRETLTPALVMKA